MFSNFFILFTLFFYLRALLKVKNKKKEGQGFGYNKKKAMLSFILKEEQVFI